MRQLRLAMIEALATSNAVLDKHRRARKKLNRDLVKAKDALRKLEELKCDSASRLLVPYTALTTGCVHVLL